MDLEKNGDAWIHVDSAAQGIRIMTARVPDSLGWGHYAHLDLLTQ